MHGEDRKAAGQDRPEALEREARVRCEAYLRRAEALYGHRLPRPEVRFDLRGTAAGLATRDGRLIRFNRQLLLENGSAFLDEVPAHEVAHVAAYVLFGPRIRPHGPEWQALMRAFGVAPRRCHSFDTRHSATRRQRRFTYRCACRRHALTTTRHRRIQRGLMSYRCRRCGEALEFVAEAAEA